MRILLQKLATIFIVAFLLNALWEEFHSFLYVHYQDGPITHAILFRAALFDASIVAIAVVLSFYLFKIKTPKALMIWMLFLFAVVLELWALSTNRWAYGALMPIIPFLGTGLTPTIQLALTGYISLYVVSFPNRDTIH